MTSMQQQLAADVPTMMALFLCGAIGYFVTRLLKPRITSNAQQCQKLETLLEDDGAVDTSVSCTPASKRNAVARKRSRKASGAKTQESLPAAASISSVEVTVPEETTATSLNTPGVLEPAAVEIVESVAEAVQASPEAAASNRTEKIMAKKALRKARKAQDAKAEAEHVATQDEVLVVGATDEAEPVLQPIASDDVAGNEQPRYAYDETIVETEVQANGAVSLVDAKPDQEKAQADSASVPSDDLEDTSCPSSCEMQVGKDGAHGKSESEDDQQRSEHSADSDAPQEEHMTVKLDESNADLEDVDEEEAEDKSREWAVYDSDEEKDLVAEYRHVSLHQAEYTADEDAAIDNACHLVPDPQETTLHGSMKNDGETLEAREAMQGTEPLMDTSPRTLELAETIWDVPHWGGSSNRASPPEATVWDAPHWQNSSKISLPPFVDGWMSSFDDLFAVQARAQADQILVPVICSLPEPFKSDNDEGSQPGVDLGIELHKILSEVGYIGMSPVNASAGADETVKLAVDEADETKANSDCESALLAALQA